MTEVAKMEQRGELTAIPDTTPMAMIDRAIQNGAGIETIEKLMGLQERWEANHARRAYNAAIAAARSEIKPIVKSAEVDFTSQKGRTHYKHETLDGIAQQIDPILARHNLSYRFRSEQADNGKLSVTCIIAHSDGYSEETTLSGPPDTSGNKNAYQAVGSAATYLQRYTLKLALGLAAAKDDDAQGAGPTGTINADQFQRISELIEQAGVETDVVCRAAGAEHLEELPAAAFASVCKRLQLTIDKKKAEADA